MPKQRKVDNLATRVAARLTKGIRSGHYKPGQQLPSERELVETYQVSRVTVNRALAMLDAKGVV